MGIVTKLNNSDSIKQLASTAQLTAGYKIDMRSKFIQFWLGDSGKFEVIARRIDLGSGGAGDNSMYGGMSFGSDGSGGRVWSTSIYQRTYSGSATMTVTSAGTLGRVTSARKYKTEITKPQEVVEKAEKILQIEPAQWKDKAEIKTHGDSKLYHGFIADEFHDLGLTEVVQYNDEGEVEGLSYDRLTIYLLPLIKNLYKEIAELKKQN